MIRFRALGALLGATLIARAAAAQGTTWNENWVGSEWEIYARALAIRGQLGNDPWILRPFAPPAIDKYAAMAGPNHPWAAHMGTPAKKSGFTLLRASIGTSYNSGFAWGFNDGALWQGRGANLWATAGGMYRNGPFSFRFEPIVERATNQAFELRTPIFFFTNPYQDDLRPGGIDLPQRFGDGPLTIAEWGQSYARIDYWNLAAGFSTENQFWGPGVRNSIILGPNASGFPHIFFGTSQPWNTPIGALHGQLMYGRLAQSDWSPPSPSELRFASGILLSWTAPHVPITFGMDRFFHHSWLGAITKEDVLAPISLGFSGDNQHGPGADNQLASFFTSIRAPAAGLEVFGEYARNDRNDNLRDYEGELEHNSAWLMGFIHVWGDTTARGPFWTTRAEYASGRIASLQSIGRNQSSFYEHTPVTQGHTMTGQLLGSPLMDRSEGLDLSFDRFSPTGQLGFTLFERQMPPNENVGVPRGDMRSQWDLGANTTRFIGDKDVNVAIGYVWDLNRFTNRDGHNFYLRLGLRARLR